MRSHAPSVSCVPCRPSPCSSTCRGRRTADDRRTALTTGADSRRLGSRALRSGSRAPCALQPTHCSSAHLTHCHAQSLFGGSRLRTVELAAFFSEKAVYHNIPLEPIAGREAIAETIDSFIRPGPPGIEAIEFGVINIAANGPVVMTERVDVFTIADKSFELPVMGTFGVTRCVLNRSSS